MDDKRITVEQDGEVLAQATVSVSHEDDEAHALAQVAVAAGHLPVGTRQKMVDAVHAAVTEDHAAHLTASVPLGDAELVQGVSSHLDDVQLRAAGSTSIIEGVVKPT